MSLTIPDNASDLRTNLSLGTAATLDTGTSANNVVLLDGTGKLPAVDGSNLTNVSAGSTTAYGYYALTSGFTRSNNTTTELIDDLTEITASNITKTSDYLVPQEAGYYYIHAQVSMYTSGAYLYESIATLQVNGVDTCQDYADFISGFPEVYTGTMSCIQYFNGTSDILQLRHHGYNDNGGLVGVGNQTSLSIFKLAT